MRLPSELLQVNRQGETGGTMKKWIWTFTVLMAFADVCISYKCRDTMIEWETNHLVSLMLQSYGFAAVILFRVLLLAFAAAMSCTKTRLSWLVAPTWGVAHAYLLVTLLVLGPELTVLRMGNPPWLVTAPITKMKSLPGRQCSSLASLPMRPPAKAKG
jgi:hypothetical protein